MYIVEYRRCRRIKKEEEKEYLPNDIRNIIMQHMEELYTQARADEERYQGFFRNNYNEHVHIVMDTDDEIDTPFQQLVPYWFYNEKEDKFTIRLKELDKINTIEDGIPINKMYRMPWKHPKLNMGKADTFLYFSDQADKKKSEREAKRRKITTSSLLDMLDEVGTKNKRGGGMKNKKVKKCEEKKVVLGKERCIYKVSGSKKDYMKYKGEVVPVSDYVKSMKKKK